MDLLTAAARPREDAQVGVGSQSPEYTRWLTIKLAGELVQELDPNTWGLGPIVGFLAGVNFGWVLPVVPIVKVIAAVVSGPRMLGGPPEKRASVKRSRLNIMEVHGSFLEAAMRRRGA